MNTDELAQLNAQFEGADPLTVLQWAADRFMPKLAATSSFQTQSVALLHLISRARPAIPIIFLDTGYHFPETLAYRDQLVEQFGLTLTIAQPAMTPAEVVRQHGDALYRSDPDLCCYINKVEPMQRALAGLDAWITGIRRDQTANRATAQSVELLSDGRIKVNPLVTWTREDLWTYINHHQLPAHPLFSQGYLSVGCAPCTAPVAPGEDERSGRWADRQKSECGLHTDALHRQQDSE
jgi:phosphoadenosine phosphosulfate reductase